jgi:hypothetical protein
MNTYNQIKTFGHPMSCVGAVYQLSKPLKIKGRNLGKISIISVSEEYVGEQGLGALKKMVSYIMPDDNFENSTLDDGIKIEHLTHKQILNLHGYFEVNNV